MSEEELKAINQVDWIRINFYDKKYGETFTEDEYSEYYESLCEVLNLIKKQQEEIEFKNDIIKYKDKVYKTTKKSLKGQIAKKDKIIDEIKTKVDSEIYIAEANYEIEELNPYARGMYDTFKIIREYL